MQKQSIPGRRHGAQDRPPVAAASVVSTISPVDGKIVKVAYDGTQ
ncbi:MAG: hypothetical protein QM625_12315 [Ralstonia sp.]|nr:hypothetical protein [Ralstonia pickettii]